MFRITSGQAAEFRKYSFRITEHQLFQPGKDCPGKEPFGGSQACRETCFGSAGLCSSRGLPIMCKHLDQKISIVG
jgi:hypothetical protein